MIPRRKAVDLTEQRLIGYSRGSSVASTFGTTTRAAKRRAGSGTPSLGMQPPVGRLGANERPLAFSSRASSIISTTSRLPRLGRSESATPSIAGEPDMQAPASQSINEDLAVDATADATDVNAPPRRGRPKKEGRGRVRGSGRGGKTVDLSRQSSQDPEHTKPAPRGRGRRTSSNRMVQAVYDRQIRLRKAYREVSKLVRMGLDAIAERNLEMIEEDPDSYKKQPEYQQVLDKLEAAETSAVSKVERRHQMDVEYLKKKHELENDYSRQIFKVSRSLASLYDNKLIISLAKSLRAAGDLRPEYQGGILGDTERCCG